MFRGGRARPVNSILMFRGIDVYRSGDNFFLVIMGAKVQGCLKNNSQKGPH